MICVIFCVYNAFIAIEVEFQNLSFDRICLLLYKSVGMKGYRALHSFFILPSISFTTKLHSSFYLGWGICPVASAVTNLNTNKKCVVYFGEMSFHVGVEYCRLEDELLVYEYTN